MALSWRVEKGETISRDYQNMLDGARVTHIYDKKTPKWVWLLRPEPDQKNKRELVLSLADIEQNYKELHTSIENLEYYIDTNNETIKQIAEFDNTTAYYLIKNNADQKELDEVLQLYIDADIEKKALKPAEAKLKEKEKRIKSHSIS